jgi:hypothetical protein
MADQQPTAAQNMIGDFAPKIAPGLLCRLAEGDVGYHGRQAGVWGLTLVRASEQRDRCAATDLLRGSLPARSSD